MQGRLAAGGGDHRLRALQQHRAAQPRGGGAGGIGAAFGILARGQVGAKAREFAQMRGQNHIGV